jgi:hypothetical protein
MIRTTAANLINFRLGKGRVDLDTDITNEMLLVQTELEHAPTLPWFLTSLLASFTGPTTGNENFVLPVDFLRMCEEGEGGIWVTDPTSGAKKLLSMQWGYTELVEEFGSEVPGMPRYLAIVGEYGYVRPIPDLDYSFTAIYMQAAQDLSTDIENKWLKYAPGMIISKTVANLANYLADNELFEKAMKDYQAEVARLVGENTARMEAGRDRVRGDPD